MDDSDREPKRPKLEEGVEACIYNQEEIMDDSDSETSAVTTTAAMTSSGTMSAASTSAMTKPLARKRTECIANISSKSKNPRVSMSTKRMIGGLRPVDMDEYSEEIDKCAKYAIKCHNDKKPDQLEYKRALKVIEGSTCGFMYFITLEARVVSTGKTKIYQAQVHDDFLNDRMILYIFRPQPGQD